MANDIKISDLMKDLALHCPGTEPATEYTPEPTLMCTWK